MFTMSIDEFARTTPVRPPIANRKTNSSAHKQAALYVIRVPYNVASHLKILIPVGTAMIIVADVMVRSYIVLESWSYEWSISAYCLAENVNEFLFSPYALQFPPPPPPTPSTFTVTYFLIL